jgi:hypothetical protein
MDRGNFFHAVYRIEQRLGRMFRELEPYSLFPLDEYFNGPSRMGPQRSNTLLSDLRTLTRPAHLEFPIPLAHPA